MVVREIKETKEKQKKQKQKIQKENTFCIHKDTRQNRKKGYTYTLGIWVPIYIHEGKAAPFAELTLILSSY